MAIPCYDLSPFKYDIGKVKEYESHIDLLIDKYCCKRP